MINDLENATKASQTCQLLTEDLRALYTTENALISNQAYELLTEADELNRRIIRLQSAIETESTKSA
jgi:hypothetical protein